MKVTITHSEPTSAFGKFLGYRVHIVVLFSEEEKAIVKNRRIGEFSPVRFPSTDKDREYYHPTIDGFISTTDHVGTLPTPISAFNYVERYKDSLRQLKKYIVDSAETLQTETFEL
ncbi:MAG: hypothetical protein ABR863_02690 [Roseiarcus sp.]|jgi:hypothetical protein